MKKRAELLRQERAEVVAKARAILDAAEADDGRDLTDEELAESNAHVDRAAAIDKQLEAYEAQARVEATAPPIVLPGDTPKLPEGHKGPVDTGEVRQSDLDNLPTPFASLGDQLRAVYRAGISQGVDVHPGLGQIQAAVLGLNEGVPSEGGFLVQTDFAGELIKNVWETGVLASRVRTIPISGDANGLVMNAIDESSRVDGSRWGGVQVYWEGEGDATTATKPTLRQIELKLRKLMGLCYQTEESMQDSVALGAIMSQAFTEEFAFQVDDGLFRGTGVGMPKGILSAGGTISVAKETGQGADTVLAENIFKMYSRMHPRSLSRAEWFINQNCWPELWNLQIAVGTGGVPLYVPPGAMSSAPYGSLMGRPVIPIEHAATVGDLGDITFADWAGGYLAIKKGGLDTASSIHVQFLTMQTAFRFSMRTDGQPMHDSALTPYLGSTTSHFVMLAERA